MPTARTGGEILVANLVAQDATHAFCVPGESYLPVLDAFYDVRDRLHLLVCRNEGGAAYMGEAYGKLTGRPGIVFVTRGPGASNAAVGIHTAAQDSSPMIVFVGQVGSDYADREAFQEIDYRRMYGSVAKWAAQIDRAERIPEYVAHAYRTAMSGRPGPVVLALPEDMLRVPTAATVLPRIEPALAAPPAAAMARLRELLVAAERPFVIVGGSGWSATACAALEQFASAWQLPVGCAFRFQDAFDNRHPNYAGDVGIGINPKLGARIEDADLVVAIGARLGEMTTGGYELLVPPRPTQKLVHVHAGAEELGRVYAADLLVHAAMAHVGPALAALAPPDAVRWRAWSDAARADLEANRVPQPVEPLDMAEVVRAIDRHVPAEAVFTNGAGNFAGWLHRFHRYAGLRHAGRTQLAPTSGAMGYGLPAAIAAALLEPERTVVNIAGDGDFLMTSQEMATAIAYGAKRLVSIVVDNGSYGTIRMHQEREYPGRVSGSDLGNPDFAALARAFGWWAADRVDATREFEPALVAALASGRPSLIHVKLPTDVITSRTTLSAIRSKAEARRDAERTPSAS